MIKKMVTPIFFRKVIGQWALFTSFFINAGEFQVSSFREATQQSDGLWLSVNEETLHFLEGTLLITSRQFSWTYDAHHRTLNFSFPLSMWDANNTNKTRALQGQISQNGRYQKITLIIFIEKPSTARNYQAIVEINGQDFVIKMTGELLRNKEGVPTSLNLKSTFLQRDLDLKMEKSWYYQTQESVFLSIRLSQL